MTDYREKETAIGQLILTLLLFLFLHLHLTCIFTTLSSLFVIFDVALFCTVVRIKCKLFLTGRGHNRTLQKRTLFLLRLHSPVIF